MKNLLKKVRKHRKGKVSLKQHYNYYYYEGYLEAVDMIIAMIKGEIKEDRGGNNGKSA